MDSEPRSDPDAETRPGRTGAATGSTVTAIVPLKHYHEPFLRAACRSLFSQTRPDWRALVVVEPEDRSHFEALLADELADPRVRLIANTGRKLAGAINTGMQAATSEFVALLLGDDCWDAQAVAVLSTAIAAHPEVDFFHSSRRVIDEHDRPISAVYPARASIRGEDFLRGSPVKHLLCWRRQLGLAVGGIDESLDSVGPDDHDFPWVMAEHGARFRAVPECLYLYRDHREGFRLTTHLPLDHHERELTRILTKHRVPQAEQRLRLESARRGFLRQCLFESAEDQAAKERSQFDARHGWREVYRAPEGGLPAARRAWRWLRTRLGRPAR